MTDAVKTTTAPSKGDLRVWHIPNVPNEGFRCSVANLVEAKIALMVLAEYDLFLGENMIVSNVQGLEVFEDGEWVEWEDENGYSFTEVIDREQGESI